MEVKRNAPSKGLSDIASPSNPQDGWVVLYNINPSTCQLLLEIWGWGETGFMASFQELSGVQMPSCINAAWNYAKAKGFTHPNYGALTVWWESLLCLLSSPFGKHCFMEPTERLLALVSEHMILYFYKRTSHLEIMEKGFVPSPFSNLFRWRLCK